MFKQIRSMLTQDDQAISGEIEADETFMGGKAKNMHKARREEKIQGRGTVGKTVVAGLLQRKGKVIAQKVDDTKAETLVPFVQGRVLPASMVYTDENASYDGLTATGYQHRRVHHSAKVYVDGDAHVNALEGFWSLVKNGIRGVYHSVSDKYLQTYLDEFAFRYNQRDSDRSMFLAFMGRIEKNPA
jgi:transposase-like protein